MDLRDALAKDGRTLRNFSAFARSSRHNYIRWVSSAKRDETRKKRILEVVERAKRNEKSLMS